MIEKLNSGIGILASYGASLATVFSGLDFIGNWILAAVPALAGAYLTFQLAEIRKEQARSIRLKNDELEKNGNQSSDPKE